MGTSELNQLKGNYERTFHYPINTDKSNVYTNPNSISGLWHKHNDRGWYYFLGENDILKAKQEFYLCGRLDELMININGTKKMSELGQNPWNIYAVDDSLHFLNALLSDNKSLISQRTYLTYFEREEYIFKYKYNGPIIFDIMFSILQENTERLEKVFPLLASTYSSKEYRFDRMFIEGCLEEDVIKMQEAIENIASPKVQNKRQKVDPNFSNWIDTVLSLSGLLYTKFAWLLGFNLDIKNPLVRVAKKLLPIEPLNFYDPIYDILKRD